MKVSRHLEFACTTESFINVWMCAFFENVLLISKRNIDYRIHFKNLIYFFLLIFLAYVQLRFLNKKFHSVRDLEFYDKFIKQTKKDN